MKKYQMDRTYLGVIASQARMVRNRMWKMMKEARESREVNNMNENETLFRDTYLPLQTRIEITKEIYDSFSDAEIHGTSLFYDGKKDKYFLFVESIIKTI